MWPNPSFGHWLLTISRFDLDRSCLQENSRISHCDDRHGGDVQKSSIFPKDRPRHRVTSAAARLVVSYCKIQPVIFLWSRTSSLHLQRACQRVDVDTMSHRAPSISPPPTKKRRVIYLRDDSKPEPEEQEKFRREFFKHEPHAPHVRSPMRLNFMPEFPASSTKDTIRLGNILGNPLIRECWLFNYLFDVDFVL